MAGRSLWLLSAVHVRFKRAVANHCLQGGSSFSPHSQALQQYTEHDERNAQIEGEVDFAPLAEDDEGKYNGVAGLQIVGQVDGEGREMLQGLLLQQVHANGAEQGMAEHEPQVAAFGDHHHGLLAGEEQQIEGG